VKVILLSLFILASCTGAQEESTIDSGYIDLKESDFAISIQTPSSDILRNQATGVSDISYSGECNFDGQIEVTNNNSFIDNLDCTKLEGTFSGIVSSADLLEGVNKINFKFIYSQIKYETSFNIAIDTITPTLTLNSISNINVANQNSYSLTGTCSEDTGSLSINIGNQNITTTCQSSVWSTGSLDTSAQTDNLALPITVNYSDSAGNPIAPTSASVLKDSTIPTVSLASAIAITKANEANYSLVGSCSENGQNISLSIGSLSFNPTCITGSWNTGFFDISGEPDSALAIAINLQDINGNPATTVTSSATKLTATPTVTIASSPNIDQSNETAYSISGTCSESGEAVNVDINSSALVFNPNCAAGTWSINNTDVSAIVDAPSILISVTHNSAIAATATIAKDTAAPTVTITSAPDINGSNQTIYQVTGTCSENGRAVNIDIASGLFTYSPNCNSGTWVTGLQDVSTLTDGAIVITANHDNASLQAANTASKTITMATATPTVNTLTAPTTYTNSVEITWNTVDPGGFTLNDYIINYRVKGTPTWLSFADGVSLNTIATITGLLPSSTYEFRVYLSYDATLSGWSNTAEGETKPDNPIFSSPNKAMNVGGASQARVVAFEDNTNVYLNSNTSPIATLSKGQTHLFTTSQFDIIDADKPIYTAGRRGSGAANNKANITFNPTSWAGKSFSFNAIRSNPQNLHVYAIEGTKVQVFQGGTLLTEKTIGANSGDTLSWSVYGSYQIVSTGTILAYHISGSGSRLVDPKPLLPSSNQIIGIPSNSMRLTATLDGTNYNYWHSNSVVDPGNRNLGKQDSVQINPAVSGSLYTSSSLLLSADKPISGASFADANGGCAAPFLPTNFMKKKYAVNIASDYVAFASKEAGTISVYSPGQTVGTDPPVDTLTLARTGSNTTAPFVVRRGTTPIGYRFVATVPVAAWYQPNNDTGGANQDETVLYGSD